MCGGVHIPCSLVLTSMSHHTEIEPMSTNPLQPYRVCTFMLLMQYFLHLLFFFLLFSFRPLKASSLPALDGTGQQDLPVLLQFANITADGQLEWVTVVVVADGGTRSSSPSAPGSSESASPLDSLHIAVVKTKKLNGRVRTSAHLQQTPWRVIDACMLLVLPGIPSCSFQFNH